MKISITAAALAVATLLGTATPSFASTNAMNPMVGRHAMLANKDIVSTAIASDDNKTLVAAVKAAGLVAALQGPGPLTVFAPTDEAFATLPAGTVETLVKPENKATLAKILTYHVVAGRLDFKALAEMIEDGKGKASLKTLKARRSRSR